MKKKSSSTLDHEEQELLDSFERVASVLHKYAAGHL